MPPGAGPAAAFFLGSLLWLGALLLAKRQPDAIDPALPSTSDLQIEALAA